MRHFIKIKLVLFFVFLMAGKMGQCGQLRLAVASNFAAVSQQLAVAFKSSSGHDLLISSASTGQLYAQITQGAPFDVFMSADRDRPQLLVAAGIATHYQIYARGILVLLSNINHGQNTGFGCEEILSSNQLKYLSIANPKLAPYGLAAQQYLQNKGLWKQVNDKLVMGENVSQATQLVASKNATAGLVAQSLMSQLKLDENQCLWPIPGSEYEPIEQAMVFLTRSHNHALFGEFRAFLQSPEAKFIIQSNGYKGVGTDD